MLNHTELLIKLKGEEIFIYLQRQKETNTLGMVNIKIEDKEVVLKVSSVTIVFYKILHKSKDARECIPINLSSNNNKDILLGSRSCSKIKTKYKTRYNLIRNLWN